ncbi:MAG TPA: class I tRNA ligase family protein [Candidatus Saccharimonadales bacterium]|nr:class I tRNA ligase family protein [Candidatus Saccharimonadales bacterium]
MKQYIPAEVEAKWAKVWDDTKLYQADQNPAKAKFYELEMFPYPSGETMHVGHVRNYVISDAHARFKRMQGFNVLHPMGWDAFGLPAENFAIKTGTSPAESTAKNIAAFKQQISAVGISYDWSREINTAQPDYYRWTQWLFLKFYHRDLAYKAEASVNWCPQDKTVLANEQVIKDGTKNVCERCGHEVEKRRLNQWFFKITDYADRLLDDLANIDWPENIKAMQVNWIGRSHGAKVKFKVESSKEAIEVFTTRIDTIYSATFLVLAPEHPMVQKLTTPTQKKAVESYQKAAAVESDIQRMETDREKTGVFTGSYAINPVNNEKLPIWLADFVLPGYGTGAVFGDGHDERDVEFASKYDIPLKTSIEPVTGTPQENPEHRRSIVAVVRDPKTKKLLSINWGDGSGGNLFVGGGIDEDEDPEQTARREVAEETGYKNLKLISQSETIHHNYFAHSKKVARSIDAIAFYFELENTEQSGQKLEPDEHGKFKVEWLSVAEAGSKVHDDLHRYAYDKFVLAKPWTGDGILYNSGEFDGLSSSEARPAITEFLAKQNQAEANTNYRMRDWLISRQRYWGAPIPIIYCDNCGTVPVPEADLPVILPEVKDYLPDGSGQSPLAKVESFVNTKCPKCAGPAKRETDTMDTFVDSSWYFLRFADPHNDKAPFEPELANYWLPVDTYVGGVEHAVAHLLYARFWTKVLADEGLINFQEPFKQLRNQGLIGGADGRKMGKRYGNVVTPDDITEQGYGADALRIYELFIGPYNQNVDWNPNGIDGAQRFIKRVWALVQEFDEIKVGSGSSKTELETALQSATHRTIKKVTDDIGSFSFNTAVAALMELTNELYKLKVDLPFADAHDAWATALNTLVQLLAPFAPFVAEELWEQLGGTESVHVSTWPKYDEKYVRLELIEVPVQVNGKLRATLTIDPAINEDDLKKAAAELENVARHLEGKQIAKTIVVPRKLVNFVIK